MIDPELMAQAAEQCVHVPTDEDFKSIAALAKKQQALEKKVADAEANVVSLKKDLAKVKELDLPDALAAVGMSEFKLDDGYTVSVEKQYLGAIPSADTEDMELYQRREACLKFLRDTGNEAIIKHKIAIETGKGDDAIAQETKRVLEEAGIPFSDTEEVHWKTLRGFIEEQMTKPLPTDPEEAALVVPFPEKTFGAFVKRVASIKAPKKKK